MIILAGIGAGVAGGLIYYFEIGCNSGGCAITSNPWMSAFTGGLLGYLLTDSFLPFFRKKPGNSETGK
ncbi:MAG: hypothetical protein JXA03_14965 [Bacteroidales bacterium]|nr:hypothetical protein [Bacteroidales bacterium]